MAIFRSAILLIGAGWLAFQDPPPQPATPGPLERLFDWYSVTSYDFMRRLILGE